MEDLIKYILLFLLTLPFVALVADTLGKTHDIMIKTVVAVATTSALIAFLMGGFHQRPNVANVFIWGFLVWPVLLLVAKGLNPRLSWQSIWLSVPVMSWYLVNLSMQFYYPTSGGGGGMGAGLALIAGWLYMMIPFTLLSGVFVGVAGMRKRLKGAQFTDGER